MRLSKPFNASSSGLAFSLINIPLDVSQSITMTEQVRKTKAIGLRFTIAAIVFFVVVYVTGPQVMTYIAYLQESNKSRAPIAPSNMAPRPENLSLGAGSSNENDPEKP